MLLKKSIDLLLILVFFIFSSWLMFKSFHIDRGTSELMISRHQVGDFGLHLALVRSVSWGNNIPVESPFYSGVPIPYHYVFDGFVGLLEGIGIPLDMAFNGVSIIAYTMLLYGIYRFSQRLFGSGIGIGLCSVGLFVFRGSVTLIDFFKAHPIDISLIGTIWRIPDYIDKGPFDGTLASLYLSFNVFLNQRHLIVALAISVWVLYFLLGQLKKGTHPKFIQLICLGLTIGLLSRVHSLIFVSLGVTVLGLYIYRKMFKNLAVVFICVIIVSGQHIQNILQVQGSQILHPLVYLGFQSPRPFTLYNLTSYWFANIGLHSVFIPLGLLWAKRSQRIFFACIFILFFIANTLQLSYRIEHNHSILNYFFLFAVMYSAYALALLWRRSVYAKVFVIGSIVCLTASGLLDLMAVKNDYQYPVVVNPRNTFMEWIKIRTPKNAIFLSGQDLYDPVTLAGRKSYLGAVYYLEVMGYDYGKRLVKVKKYYETPDESVIAEMKREGIGYIVIPKETNSNFPYAFNRSFWKLSRKPVYSDALFEVFHL